MRTWSRNRELYLSFLFVLGTTGTDVMRWLLHGFSCSLLSLFFLFFLVKYQTIILVHGGRGVGGVNPCGISTVSISTFYPHHPHKSCLALLSSWARIEKNAILHSFLFCILAIIISTIFPSFLSSYESFRKSQILLTSFSYSLLVVSLFYLFFWSLFASFSCT